MRLTFLSHFVLSLAIAAGAFFAFMAGVPQRVWATDVSMMTSVIAVLFAGSAAYLGLQSWRADEGGEADTSFGYLAAEVCLVAGVIGMALGLAMQGEAIAKGGAAVFGPWATQLYSTITGCVAYGLLLILSYNVERGAKR